MIAVPPVSRRFGTNKVTAISVREHGTTKFSPVSRFMFTVPSSLEKTLNTCIAVPKNNLCLEKTFFIGARVEKENTQGFRTVAEQEIMEPCELLTLGQRCADWFILRQFRITDTNADQLLLSIPEFKSKLFLVAQSAAPQRNEQGSFDGLYEGCFSSKTSSEEMMRATANESAVSFALTANTFVQGLLEVGILTLKSQQYLGCSLDGIAFIYLQIY